MPDFNIILPSKPKIIAEEGHMGVYEIEGLYPGYGHTLGNSLRRIMLSSIPGFSIVSIKIEDVNHEFTTIKGIKEDVINIILNLKKVRFKVDGDKAQIVKINAKGQKEIKAGDIDVPGQVEVMNKDQHVATLTDKNSSFVVEITLEKGLGYVSKEVLQKDKVDVGTIAVDAIFTPIRKASYEVENMRVEDRTDFNKLRVHIETDGTISPRETLERSITVMIQQLKAIVGFKEENEETYKNLKEDMKNSDNEEEKSASDKLKTKIEDFNLSFRTTKALTNAGIKTLGGLAKKKEEDLLNISGIGDKGVQEIKGILNDLGITLK